MPIPWIPVIIAAGIGGVAIAMGVGKSCKVLSTPEALNAWARANQNRKPSTFLMLGVWLETRQGEPNPVTEAFLQDICDDPPAETIALDYDALGGKDLDFLKEHGIDPNFPTANMALAIRMKPTPQFYLGMGESADQLEEILVNIRAFFDGELEGEPIIAPGATYTKGETLKEGLVRP